MFGPDWKRSFLAWSIFLLLSQGCSPIAPVDLDRLPQHSDSFGSKSSPIDRDSAFDNSMRARIRKTIQEGGEHRRLSLQDNAAWQIMHGVIAYGDKLQAHDGNKNVNVLDYLLGGGTVQGWELGVGEMLPCGRRGMKARLEPGSYIGQGHVDQWIAILAQAGVPLDRRVLAGGQEFTVEDWVRQAQYDVSDNPVLEYSWTLISLMRYFPEETSWTAKDGKRWEFDSLVEFEAKQDLTESPCGGMHRLTALAHAVAFRRHHGQPIDGAWKLAHDRIEESIGIAQRFQNADGSFSSNYTQRPGTTADLNMMISATGHTLEFLAFALPESRLNEDWVERSANRLCKMIQAASNVDLDCGGLYHALNGLKIYERRRFIECANLPVGL